MQAKKAVEICANGTNNCAYRLRNQNWVFISEVPRAPNETIEIQRRQKNEKDEKDTRKSGTL